MADLAVGLVDHLTVGQWPESGYGVYLPPEIHRQPIYALGISGTGKSTLLGNLALQWSRMDEGVLLIDVKDGQLARDVAGRADADRLIVIAPGLCQFADGPHHWGLNILELPDRHRQTVSQVVDNVLSMLERLDRADYTQMTTLRTQLDSAVRLALYEPQPQLRLAREVLTDAALRRALMAKHASRVNAEVADHFQRFDDPKANSSYGRSQQITSTVNRLKELLTPPELAYMLIQPHSTIKLAEWLEAGKLVVVDCASGMSNRNAELLGNLVLTQAMHVTFTRRVTETSRYVRLICDEFDLLAGNNFARLITKARSYRVLPVMAHQNKDQLRADRDRSQTLFNAASGVPVEFEFTLTDQDRAQMMRLRRYEARDELEAFTARLRLRKQGLPLGLLEAGQSALIRLADWRDPVIPGQVERAIAAQERLTTPEREIKRDEQRTEVPTDEPRRRQPPPPTPRTHPLRSGADEPPAQAVRADPRRSAGAGGPEPLPDDDGVAAGQTALPGGSFGRWQPPRPGRRPQRG